MILLVEDEASVRKALAEILRREQHTVLEAENGKRALRVLEAFPVSLIITDLVLPDLDGLTLIGRFRKRQPQLPIIMISGYVSQPAGEDMLAKTAGEQSAYLAKPFTMSELTASARCLLDLRTTPIEHRMRSSLGAT